MKYSSMDSVREAMRQSLRRAGVPEDGKHEDSQPQAYVRCLSAALDYLTAPGTAQKLLAQTGDGVNLKMGAMTAEILEAARSRSAATTAKPAPATHVSTPAKPESKDEKIAALRTRLNSATPTEKFRLSTEIRELLAA
jgi:hypothetical protein